MCGNNTSNTGGGGGSSVRNAKKQRIPKRGPGVAELEKLLRDQQNKRNGTDQKSGNITLFSHTSYSAPSSSLQRNVTFRSDHNSAVIALPAANYTNVNDGNGNGSQLAGGGCSGRVKGVYIDGSGVFLPEQTLLPISWVSSKGEEEENKVSSDFSFPLLVSKESDHAKLFPPLICQRTHPSMMNLFPQSKISSSSAGVYHHVEPSSNQKPYLNHISTMSSEEEDKMIETKQPRPNFPVDNWPPAPAPPSRACQFPLFHPDVSRLDPSSNNHGIFSPGIASRDPEPSTRPLELKVKNKCVNPNHQPDFSKFKQFSFNEERKENFVGLAPKEGFFNLLTQPEDQRDVEDKFGFKNTEKTECCIDLDLKL